MMNRGCVVWALALLVLAVCGMPPPAQACGGGFGRGLEVRPERNVLVAHHDGIETYLFDLRFCGLAAEFGLILPVPDKLTEKPSLAERRTFTDLEELTKPEVKVKKECIRVAGVGGAPGKGAGGGGSVHVEAAGHVGIFDWSLLRADTTKAFTDWLDANHYPYPSEASALDAFRHYVDKKWHFVAFKVTAASKEPALGERVCGDFGPLRLAFPASSPIVPVRVLGAAPLGAPRHVWEIYTVGKTQLRTDFGRVRTRFSGPLTAEGLAGAPSLKMLAQAGDRLTRLEVTFLPKDAKDDMAFRAVVPPEDFREVVYRTENAPELCPPKGLFDPPADPSPAVTGGLPSPVTAPQSVPKGLRWVYLAGAAVSVLLVAAAIGVVLLFSGRSKG